MKTARLFVRGSAVAGPLALLAVPKCPLCLLPLLGTTGLAVATGPALSATFIGLAAVWAVAMFALARSPAVLAVAAIAAGLASAGRLLGHPALSWGGIVLMIAHRRRLHPARRRACGRGCGG